MLTTPYAYSECSMLISLSGVFDGIAATTGLSKTSLKPAETEKIHVPITSPKKAYCGKSQGTMQYTSNPNDVMSGITVTVFLILKREEKKVNTKSMASWVQKFIATKDPKSVYEILYIS